MSFPVVESDVKNCLFSPHFWTSVVFRSKDEIDKLILALQQLREAFDSPTFHVHLQDEGLSKTSSFACGEIVFHSAAMNAVSDVATERINDFENAGNTLKRVLKGNSIARRKI